MIFISDFARLEVLDPGYRLICDHITWVHWKRDGYLDFAQAQNDLGLQPAPHRSLLLRHDLPGLERGDLGVGPWENQ